MFEVEIHITCESPEEIVTHLLEMAKKIKTQAAVNRNATEFHVENNNCYGYHSLTAKFE